MKIIPAIDLIEGKCVRLEQGDYARKKVYNANPVEVAKSFEDKGVKYLHLVDLDGAKAGHIVNWKVLKAIAEQTSLHIDFGGGVKRRQDLEVAFENGAKQVTGGSIAVKNKAEFQSWIETYGGEKIILGADVKEEKIAISGWKEITDIGLFAFVKEYQDLGIQSIICTDIQKDGLLSGSSVDLYRRLIETFPGLKVVASGGVSSLEEIQQLEAIGTYGAIIGKALYEKKLTIEALKPYLDR